MTFTQLTPLQHMLLWRCKPEWMLISKHKSSNWDARRILPRIAYLSKKGLIQLLKILHRNLDCARSGNEKNPDTWLFDLQSDMVLNTPHKKEFSLHSGVQCISACSELCFLQYMFCALTYSNRWATAIHLPYSPITFSWLLYASGERTDKVVD